MSDKMQPWTSKLLQGLGVKEAAVPTRGVIAKACGVALAAALTVAMGGISMDANAGERIKKETAHEAASSTAYSVVGIEKGDTAFERTTKVAATIGQVVLSPEAGVISLVGQAAVGSATGASAESSSKGKHAAEIVGTAVGVTVAAPVFGVLMIANQAHNTYVFVQEEQEKNVKLKMEEVGDRVASVKADFTQQMRLEDRTARQNWPEERKAIDQNSMYQAAVAAEMAGGGLTESEQIRYDMEAKIAAEGGATEPWFDKFSAEKEQIAQVRAIHEKQMLADADGPSEDRAFESVTGKIQISAAQGGSALPSSNKNFAAFSQEASKSNEKKAPELSR